ncbi:MAG: RNB domain-containing ribonuclease [Leptolyngbya sp. DLM2.Bin15]|nr:MAG: RNB domain-containing ribonuclease [Leptolyngbya sp. DLM2.Bin15]
MDKGTLVEFRVSGDRRLGVVDRAEGKKWVVVDDRGLSHTLHTRQVTYEVVGQTYKADQLEAFLAGIQSYLDPSSLEVAWELLVEDGETVNPSEMALLLFSEQTPELCYAAHCLLSDDKLYFKQKGDRYEPRSASQVAELKHQFTMASQRAQERESFYARIQQALQGEPVEWQKSDRPRIESLERFATLGDEAIHPTAALEILAGVGYAETAEAAFQLLVDLQLWDPHENLFVRRSQLPTQFPSKVVEMAHSRLLSPPPDTDPDRLDLTHLKTYTVDDESTSEIDDGLSLETLDTGIQRIWVHIADPTRWLSLGDDIDLEARRRCTTVYLPTGMVPMFPSELATGPMSLVQGEICNALSFGVILDESGEVMDYTIAPSRVRPTYRLTYDDVDEMLELGVKAEAELEAIARWADVRQAWRTAQGAICIRMPESSIRVQADEIIIQVLDDSLARRLVAEMMILAGEVAGRYGQAHGLPLPFRGQPQPELPSDDELMQLPPGLVRECAVRRCMPRSETSISPLRHASLGLDTYTQVTSPIRRYTDLIAHFQIKAHLRGETPPIAAKELEEMLMSVSSTAYESTLVERQTNRYWGLEYLRRHPNQSWSALILRWLREQDNLGLILIEDLGLELAMRFKREVELGDHVEVKASYVDPRKDIIQFVELLSDPATVAS